MAVEHFIIIILGVASIYFYGELKEYKRVNNLMREEIKKLRSKNLKKQPTKKRKKKVVSPVDKAIKMAFN